LLDLGHIFYPIKPLAGLFILIKSHEAFPLKGCVKKFLYF
jgi:hypothetical protein